MAPPPKLTDDQVKQIRRRVRQGELQTKLVHEYGVTRKTIWRRLEALESKETEEAERLAAKRLGLQATRERQKLRRYDEVNKLAPTDTNQTTQGSASTKPTQELDPKREWLATPKNLSGRAFAEAHGLVRVRDPDGTICRWVERPDVDPLLDKGWTLA
jgi:hypothetical protein